MHSIYPWQQSQWQYLTTRINNRTLPHALLLNGPSGLGKTEFALTLAELLLCEQQNACGYCKSCKLIQAGNHPDFHYLHPNTDGKMIKIEQIREIIAAINKKSQQNSYQVVIINPAENMHPAASNALLKTLEEPTDPVIFILVTNCPSILPATIRSRCQHITFHIPDKQLTTSWLKQKTNIIKDNLPLLSLAPLTALALASDENQKQRQALLEQLTSLIKHKVEPLKFASSILDIDTKQLLNYLHSWFMDLLRLKFNLPQKFIINSDYLEVLQNLTPEINTKKILACLDKIVVLYKSFDNNLNQQLMLEDLSILINQ